ncbi:30S ribosomal protein S18 [Streptomyces sp. NPDC008092]|uniref:30S ribosomal protein S18 n=1 Tax=Streptomyces sp. NPDC008092 TaxID=3364808 RepID=UPI0036E90338
MPRKTDRGPVKRRPDPLERAGVTYIDYKDTDLLRKFLSDRGRIRSRRVTGVSARQQRLLARAVKNAREMALLPYGTARQPVVVRSS